MCIWILPNVCRTGSCTLRSKMVHHKTNGALPCLMDSRTAAKKRDTGIQVGRERGGDRPNNDYSWVDLCICAQVFRSRRTALINAFNVRMRRPLPPSRRTPPCPIRGRPAPNSPSFFFPLPSLPHPCSCRLMAAKVRRVVGVLLIESGLANGCCSEAWRRRRHLLLLHQQPHPYLPAPAACWRTPSSRVRCEPYASACGWRFDNKCFHYSAK